MKTPQDTTLLMQAVVSITFAIAFAVLIVYALIYHNTTIIPYALAGLTTIYAHWVPSPAQQSTMTSLIQQITPMITTLMQTQQKTAIPQSAMPNAENDDTAKRNVIAAKTA